MDIAGGNIDQVISAIQNAAPCLSKWLSCDETKVKPEKCHLLFYERCKKEVKILVNTIDTDNKQKT